MTFGFHRQPPSHSLKKDYVPGIVLGKGGYGEVKLATHTKTGKEYALKVVDKKLIDVSTQVQRVSGLMGLSHPHVIKLVTYFESTTKFYMIFELARGGELYDHLLDEVRFGEAEAREIAGALADALRYIHEHRIVHRDVKLENVLYRTPPGKGGAGHADCVLSDFGLAAVLTDEQPKLYSVCGSAGYSAPEVYSNEGYDTAADMWSFGVSVFALMGGRFPYKATDPFALAYEARTTQLYFPASWNTISPLAKDFVSRLLIVDPSRRMTAAEALQHPWLTTPLEQILDLVPTMTSSSSSSTSSDGVTPRPTVARRATKPPECPQNMRGKSKATGLFGKGTVNAEGLPCENGTVLVDGSHLTEEPEEDHHDEGDGFSPLEKIATSC